MAAAVFTELEKTNFDFQFVLDHLQANPQCANITSETIIEVVSGSVFKTNAARNLT